MPDIQNKKKKVIVIILLILLAALLFSFLIDKQLALGIQKLRNPSIDNIIISLSFEWNDLSFLIFLVAVMLILFLRKDKIKNLGKIILSALMTLGIAYILKFLIERTRPIDSMHLSEPIVIIGSSFPSAHAAVVFSLLPFIWKEYPRARYLWILYGIFIIFSRLWFAAHYLSDSIGGVIIGLSIGILVLNIGQKNKK